MEFKPQLPHPGFAERSSKMYILPTLTYLEVGGAAGASKIFIFEHFKWEPMAEEHGRVSQIWCSSDVGSCRSVRGVCVAVEELELELD